MPHNICKEGLRSDTSCDGTSQVIRPTYSCPCPTDIRHPVDVPKSLDKFGIFFLTFPGTFHPSCRDYRTSEIGMAVGKVPSGHTKPYPYPLGKNWPIPIPTTHHGYKITPYSYPPWVAVTHRVPIPINITIDMIIWIAQISTSITNVSNPT